jgi:hypothetical protein
MVLLLSVRIRSNQAKKNLQSGKEVTGSIVSRKEGQTIQCLKKNKRKNNDQRYKTLHRKLKIEPHKAH